MDKNTSGTLSINHLVQLLSGSGADPMTRDEIDELFSFCEKVDNDQSEIKIKSMLNVLSPKKAKTQRFNILPTLAE